MHGKQRASERANKAPTPELQAVYKISQALKPSTSKAAKNKAKDFAAKLWLSAQHMKRTVPVCEHTSTFLMQSKKIKEFMVPVCRYTQSVNVPN